MRAEASVEAELESQRCGWPHRQRGGRSAELERSVRLLVQLFSESNEKLMETLQRIEDSLNNQARSDEQLAYYVAQAREVIDLSIPSQKQIVEDLQRLFRQAGPCGEA